MEERNIEIDLCGPKICNLVELKDANPIVKKYEEARVKFEDYKRTMRELQHMFEDHMGSILILRGTEGLPSLEYLTSKYGVELRQPDPADAA